MPKVDSKIYENIARVEALTWVGGEEGTPKWEQNLCVPRISLIFDGVTLDDHHNDRHYGRTRIARPYQLPGDWAKREVRNERQVSVATLDDLKQIADELELTEAIAAKTSDFSKFMAKVLAVNIVIDGPDLNRYLGPGTKLMIGEPVRGAIIEVSEAHLPCSKPPTAIARELPGLDFDALKSGFKAVAAERRGYMASVYLEGMVRVEDTISAQPPIDHRTERADWRPE